MSRQIRGASLPTVFCGYGLLHAAMTALGLSAAASADGIPFFWPAAGLLLAACLICRRIQRWTLLAAAFASELAVTETAGAGQSLGVSLYQAAATTLLYGLAAVSVERWWRNPEPAGLPKLARGAVLVALVISGGLALVSVGLAWAIETAYLPLYHSVLSSYLLGTMTVTPIAITWWMAATGHRSDLSPSAAEILTVVGFSAAMTYAVFEAGTLARYQPAFLVFPILFWAGMRFPPRYGVLLAFGITCAWALWPRQPAELDYPSMLMLQLCLITSVTAGLLVAIANYERRKTERSLRGYARALAAAENRVRRSTAADLHDGIGQELYGLSMLLSAGSRGARDPAAAQTMSEAVDMIKDISARTRNVIEELDPPWIFDVPFARAIRWLIDRFSERAGLSVSLELEGHFDNVGAEDRALIFRSIRELLQNVVRHAGVATATVSIAEHAEGVEVTVADSGRGFDNRFEMPGQLHGGYGLFSVREQLLARNAEFHVDTAPGQGCTVSIFLPREDDPAGRSSAVS